MLPAHRDEFCNNCHYVSFEFTVRARDKISKFRCVYYTSGIFFLRVPCWDIEASLYTKNDAILLPSCASCNVEEFKARHINAAPIYSLYFRLENIHLHFLENWFRVHEHGSDRRENKWARARKY